MKRFTTVVARRASFHAVASVTSVNHAWRLCASNNVAAPGGDPAADFQASTVASTTLAAPVSSVSPTPAAPTATPAGAAPQSLNGIAVFVVDLDVKQVGPLGVDYDPAEFILSLLEVKADQSHRTAKLSFKGVNDAEALSKCRKFVYPADAEATGAKVTLSPDVMIDAQGNATGGREIIYVPTTRTPVVALRSVVARFAAGKHTLLPLWRLPGGADGGDDLSDVSGLRTFARKLDSNCHIDGGFLGSVARLLSRAAATNVPLDSVADRPSQTLPVRHFTAADAATRMQFPPPSVPFVTPQKSIKDELAASKKAASTPLGDASTAVDTGKVKVAKTVKRGANVAKATPPSTPDVATSAAVAEVPAAAELTPDAATTPTDAPSDDAVASPPSVKPTAPRKKRATPPSTSAAATTAEAAKQDELQTPTTPSRKQQATAATKATRVKKGAKAVAKKTPVSKKPAITKKASSGKTVKKSGKIVALKKKSASKPSAASKKKLVKKALAKKKDRLNKKVSAGSKTKAPPSKPKKATAKCPTFAKKAKLSIRAPSAAKKSSARPAKPKKTTTTTKNKTAQKKKKN